MRWCVGCGGGIEAESGVDLDNESAAEALQPQFRALSSTQCLLNGGWCMVGDGMEIPESGLYTEAK